MTGSVFLSWSIPDEQAILALKDRLVDVGLKVWEYRESAAAGGDIHDEIIKAINAVEVAIICFTDATADRPWIVRESEWCFKASRDGDKPLRHIIPVWVGPHPDNKVPRILADANIGAKDLADPTPTTLASFIEELFGRMGRQAPRETPAALFAMTDAQCDELFAEAQHQDRVDTLRAICAAAGMDTATLQQQLRGRYGAAASDLKPFMQAQTFLDFTNVLLREANAVRVRKGQRPVLLKWMQDTVVGAGRLQSARNEWAAGDSLLVIDAASALHPDVKNRLVNLPASRRPERSTMLWLPPYTHHTAAVEQRLSDTASAANIGHLDDAFSEWHTRDSLRSLTFDTFTLSGAALWLRRALLDVEDGAEPVPSAVQSLRGASTARFNLGRTLDGAPGQ